MGSATYDFSGETAIVTGGASGIGRAIALAFGDAGATVLVADVREEPKDAGETTPTHERIVEAGGRAEYVETDVSDPDQVASVVEAAREFGGLDVMVNNAGLYRGGHAADADVDDLDAMYGVNVRGTFLGCRAAAREFREREPGCIVNTASVSSTQAQYAHVGYNATKGAVMMVTRCVALDLAPEVRVNAVAPGIIATEFARGAEGARESVREGETDKPVPLERAGEPGDVAPAALYLASEEARYVTGELLHVDGGYAAF